MRAAAALRVVRRALVRIFAVGQVEHLLERQHERLWERLTVSEPRRDRRLVCGGRRERLGGELSLRVERELALGAQLVEDEAVALRPADGSTVGEILRCTAQHRWAADVDHLDGLRFGDALLRGDLLERIEIDADEIEGLDLVLFERREIVVTVAAREDPSVDARVQRLDAAAEHLGRFGDRFDTPDGQTELFEVGGGAAARDELPAELGETTCEHVETGFVVRRDQRAHSSSTTRGSSRCSSSLIRACNVSGVSSGRTAMRSCASTGPESTPSSTRCTVAPDSRTPALSCSSTACAPGNSGSSDGWTLTTLFGKRSRNAGVSRCM